MKKIGQVVAELGISADTLRYYEKIGLLVNIQRTQAGIRLYSDGDLSRLKFIKRAQKIGFSLEAIGQLLEFRQAPEQAKPQVRTMAEQKLSEIEAHLVELTRLRDELQGMVEACNQSAGACPILQKLDDN